jgi:hypothetical protein
MAKKDPDEGPDLDPEIQELLASERSARKGRGKLSAEQRKENEQIQRDIVRALRYRDDRRFNEMLRKYGWKEGEERWTNAWKVYRAYWGQS